MFFVYSAFFEHFILTKESGIWEELKKKQSSGSCNQKLSVKTLSGITIVTYWLNSFLHVPSFKNGFSSSFSAIDETCSRLMAIHARLDT